MQNRVPWATARRLPWATQQMTNDGRSLALPITVKNLFRKVSEVHNSCFQLQVNHFYSQVDFHRNHL